MYITNRNADFKLKISFIHIVILKQHFYKKCHFVYFAHSVNQKQFVTYRKKNLEKIATIIDF